MMELEPGVEYTRRESQALVIRRPGLANRRPSIKAPPPEQPGSVDWAAMLLFGSSEEMVRMVETLVAGAGAKAEEKWIRFCLLYREWEGRWKRGLLPNKPTLNQVCFSLGMDFQIFFKGIAIGVQQSMKSITALQASLKATDIVEASLDAAVSKEATALDRQLGLRLAGVLDEKGAVSNGLNINISQQQAVVLNQGEKDKLKAPLLQFSQTIEEVDTEIRRTDETVHEGSRS